MVNTRLQINTASETNVDISWEKSECPPYDYTVDYTLVNLEGCDDTAVTTSIGSVAKDDIPSATLENLSPSSDYEVIVISMNKDGHQKQLSRSFVTLKSGETEIEKFCETSILITNQYLFRKLIHPHSLHLSRSRPLYISNGEYLWI